MPGRTSSEADRRARAERLFAGTVAATGGPVFSSTASSEPPQAGALDRLSNLAARLLNAETVQVVLVSDTRHVVAAADAAGRSVADRIPAGESLCGDVVTSGQPLTVDDTVSDQRYRSLPVVGSGQVRSYAGVPLIDAGGAVVGALCAIDTAPRDWSDLDVLLLAELAGPTMAELELAALVSDYDDDRMVWQLAVDAAGVGAWDWNLLTSELRWDQRLLDIFDLDRESFGGTIEAFFEAVHPDDRERVGAALDGAKATGGAYEAEYRVPVRDGSTRWIAARGRAITGPDGVAVRVVGAAYDTTAVRDGDARMTRVLETMPSAYYHLDAQWQFTYVNAQAERLLGRQRAELLGRSLWELFPKATGGELEQHYRSVTETGRPVTFDAFFGTPVEAWYELRAWPSEGGIAVYLVDVSERYESQAKLDRAAARQRLTARVSDALTATLDVGQCLTRLAELMVPDLADWCVLAEVPASGPGWRYGVHGAVTRHADLDRLADVDAFAAGLDAVGDDSPFRQALAGTTSTVGPGALAPPGLPVGSAVFLPLLARGRTAGVMALFRGPERRAFSASDVELLTDVGARAGLALDNARLYAAQAELAQELQRSLLSEPPRLEQLDIAVRYEPAAATAQVGGDWYDAITLSHADGGNATMVTIGDVLGHDSSAAASMGQLRSLLRGASLEEGRGPADVLTSLDRLMAALQLETTATVVVARIEQDPADQAAGRARVRWSNAGHPPPLLVGADGEVRALSPGQPNLLLGLDPEAPRHEHEIHLERGSTLLLYTDGLIERRGEGIDDGIRNAAQALAALHAPGCSLEALCDGVLRRLLPVAGEDDVAMLAVRLAE